MLIIAYVVLTERFSVCARICARVGERERMPNKNSLYSFQCAAIQYWGAQTSLAYISYRKWRTIFHSTKLQNFNEIKSNYNDIDYNTKNMFNYFFYYLEILIFIPPLHLKLIRLIYQLKASEFSYSKIITSKVFSPASQF